MVSEVVEVVVLLGPVKGGFCRSSAARAVVNRVTAAVEDSPSPYSRPLPERPCSMSLVCAARPYNLRSPYGPVL